MSFFSRTTYNKMCILFSNVPRPLQIAYGKGTRFCTLDTKWKQTCGMSPTQIQPYMPQLPQHAWFCNQNFRVVRAGTLNQSAKTPTSSWNRAIKKTNKNGNTHQIHIFLGHFWCLFRQGWVTPINYKILWCDFVGFNMTATRSSSTTMTTTTIIGRT